MMSRANARIRLLNLIRARHAMTIEQIAAETGDRPRDLVASLLRELQTDGLIDYDPETTFYRPTPGAPMKIRKNKTTTTTEATVADLNQERDRLIVEMNGERGLCLVAIEDDAVLHERFCIAAESGMPIPDLTGVSAWKRPQVIEDAVDFWTASTAHGSCGFCGSRTLRHGFMVTRGFGDPTETPGFTVQHGQKCCGACLDGFIGGHTIDEAREILFNAVAGTKGLPVGGTEYRHRDATLTPFAFEVGFAGTAWGYWTTERRQLVLARAYQVVHRSRFALTPMNALETGVLGLKSPHWERDALPGKERRVFAPVADLLRAAEDEIALAERREKAEAAKAEKYNSPARRKSEQVKAARAAEAERSLAKRLRDTGVADQIAQMKRSGIL